MVSVFADFLTSFVLGLLTPLTAVCVLPLYPGFLAYLSNKLSGNESKISEIFSINLSEPMILSSAVRGSGLKIILILS